MRLLLLLSVLPAVASAHTGEPLSPHDLWFSFEFDPGVLMPLLLAALLYLRGAGKQPRLTLLHQSCFWVGWSSLSIALISPLHPLGEVLFAAHMVQHEILMLVSAPLLVMSRPMVTFLWALPMEWRRVLGRWSKWNPIAVSWGFFTAPAIAWLLHAAAIWLWHIPYLFQLTLKSDLAHTAQHLSFFGSALLFWWAVFYAQGRKAYGAAFLYVFSTAIHTGILGALLTFSPYVWYPAYAVTTQAWGFTPLEDQQIGGLVMWVPASLIYLAAGLWLFAGWMTESDVRLERIRHAK